MVSARFSAPLACLIDGAEIPKLVFDDCSEGYVYTGKWNERQGTSKYSILYYIIYDIIYPYYTIIEYSVVNVIVDEDDASVGCAT